MIFLTSVTQKGQITLPKKFREKLAISAYDTVGVRIVRDHIQVMPKKDVLDLAGSIKIKPMPSALKAREKIEKKYQRS